jgi:membrane associated rhomboid family serine protease
MLKFLQQIPNYTRALIILLVTLFVGEFINTAMGRPFADKLYMVAPAVWKGQIWRLVTHPIMAGTVIDLLLGVISMIVLAPRLERVWSGWQLWTYCLIMGIGTGLVVMILSLVSINIMMTGPSCLTFGMMAAWMRLFGDEHVLLFGIWEITIMRAGLLFGLLSFAFLPWMSVLVLFLIGLMAWFYLTIRWKMNAAVQSRPVSSDRIRNLEL